ncbi:FHA domain-containing protein FhaB/FipA [Vallicoccus soli]|uniref:FHA domain-containing protein n=1 Tax=Vallicoccus soli TaxID=2339232 RepID=A0A3A3YXD7_9ACTN|nr:FHA domain-containing protein [Vallicoccus soli]
MSELTLTVIRLGFLAVLWLFVLTAVSVMRSDLFGTRVATRGGPGGRAATRPKAPKAAKAPRVARQRGSTLVVTRGTLAGTSLRLGETPVTVGRAQDCTVVLDDDYASGHHARLFPRDGAWWVEDLGSTNGTYLDRQKVTAPVQLPLGVPLRIGKSAFELRK